MQTYNVSKSKWKRAYNIAILNVSLFFVISLAMWGYDVRLISLNLIGPGIYFFGASLIFIIMIKNGAALAPIAWYIAGTALFFGAGTIFWGLFPNISGEWLVVEDLYQVNLLNSSSILIVLLAGFQMSTENVFFDTAKVKEKNVKWLTLYKVLIPVVIVSIVFKYYYFPIPENLFLRSVLSKLNFVEPLYLLLTGVFWGKLPTQYKVLSASLLTIIIIYGVLSLSKTDVIFPVLAFMSGLWLNSRSNLVIIITIISFLLVFIIILTPIVKYGRANSEYDAVQNTLGERISIIFNNKKIENVEELDQPGKRISHGFIQRFLINEYLNDRPGSSIDGFLEALVPRIFWPDKPNITRFGNQLNNLYFNYHSSSSALAPTYPAEAFWNYGTLGVILISIVIGLELGWLTRRWFFALQGNDHAYFTIAFPAIYMGINLESWFVASYIGGFITLVVMWWIFKLLLSVKWRFI